jgi:hypothetical protein
MAGLAPAMFFSIALRAERIDVDSIGSESCT